MSDSTTIRKIDRAVSMPELDELRKKIPVASGFLFYFPDATAAVAKLSGIGNDQHNPGKPLHWDRSKSGNELDALSRHLLMAGTLDSDNVPHSVKVAWRAMANLQKEVEKNPEVYAEFFKLTCERPVCSPARAARGEWPTHPTNHPRL